MMRVGDSVKYLSITLDRRLDFNAHFAGFAPRMVDVLAHLCRLFPIISCPEYRVRRLYVNVI